MSRDTNFLKSHAGHLTAIVSIFQDCIRKNIISGSFSSKSYLHGLRFPIVLLVDIIIEQEMDLAAEESFVR